VTHLSWVVTAYVLASTVTTPLYGKLGDLYGRKRWLMIAIVIFLIGSALSARAVVSPACAAAAARSAVTFCAAAVSVMVSAASLVHGR